MAEYMDEQARKHYEQQKRAWDILCRALNGKLGDQEYVIPLSTVVQVAWVEDGAYMAADIYPTDLNPFVAQEAKHG